jgi:folate-dependent phosphoribosylglycinamide formyltransferase PurN
LKNLFNKPEGRLPRAVIFVSGTGTNAEKAIEQRTSWEPAAIVTDVKDCPATKLAKHFGLPMVEFDIADFYRANGEEKVSLRTERGRELREQWTDKLCEMLSEYEFDFGLLAGFKSLSNITNDFPCLNVHPGDLTHEKDGERLLTGLHASPIEKAILHKHESLRSCVILALPYSDEGNDMDSGIILGVSHQVPLVLQDYTLAELEAIAAKRIPGKRVHDELRLIAEINLEHLKYDGDWIVFPPVVNDFASGYFSIDKANNLYYIKNGESIMVKTVEYDASGNRIPQID